jgi:hypothetical protein
MKSIIEHKVQNALFELLDKPNSLLIPNAYIYRNEIDLAYIDNRRYFTDFEIKSSLQDYKNDLGKKKHKQYSRGKLVPNHFYFVVPVQIISKIDRIPHYGYMAYNSNYKLVQIQRALLLKASKINNKAYWKLRSQFYHKYWSNRTNEKLNKENERKYQFDHKR